MILIKAENRKKMPIYLYKYKQLISWKLNLFSFEIVKSQACWHGFVKTMYKTVTVRNGLS